MLKREAKPTSFTVIVCDAGTSDRLLSQSSLIYLNKQLWFFFIHVKRKKISINLKQDIKVQDCMFIHYFFAFGDY